MESETQTLEQDETVETNPASEPEQADTESSEVESVSTEATDQAEESSDETGNETAKVPADPVEDSEPVDPVVDPIDEHSEAENQLIHIANAERLCRIKEAEVESAKEELKFAKADYDQAVAKLRSLAEAAMNDQSRPLLIQGSQESTAVENDQDESESTAATGWESQPVSVLWAEPIKGFGKAKQELIADEISTLGGFERLRNMVGTDADHLSKLMPKGIGETLADELESRHLDFVSKFSDQEPATDESVAETDAADIQFENQLLERIGELEDSSNEWFNADAATDSETMEAGSFAFESDQPLHSCPFDAETSDLDDWLRGYWSAKLVAVIEDAEESGQPEAGDSETESDSEYEDVPDDESDDGDLNLDDL